STMLVSSWARRRAPRLPSKRPSASSSSRDDVAVQQNHVGIGVVTAINNRNGLRSFAVDRERAVRHRRNDETVDSKVLEAAIALSHCSGASMATRKITITLGTFVGAAVLSFAAGVYSVEHIGDWTKSGFDSASTEANAEAAVPAAARAAAAQS